MSEFIATPTMEDIRRLKDRVATLEFQMKTLISMFSTHRHNVDEKQVYDRDGIAIAKEDQP